MSIAPLSPSLFKKILRDSYISNDFNLFEFARDLKFMEIERNPNWFESSMLHPTPSNSFKLAIMRVKISSKENM